MLTNASSDQARKDISQRTSGSLPAGKILLCVVSYPCSTILSSCVLFICALLSIKRFSVDGPETTCSGVIWGNAKCLQAPSTYLQNQNFWRCRLGLSLLRSRCSASMTDRYILLLASLVRNKLFLPLFWLLDFFLLLLFFLITTSWQQSKERGDLYMSYRRISTSGSHCSQEVDYSCYAHEGCKPQ